MIRYIVRLVANVMKLIILILIVGGAAYAFWFTHRSRPEPVEASPLFQGITYTRTVLDSPRPLNVHIIEVDLDAPGLSFFVTPRNGQGTYEQAARRTSEFLRESKLQVAVNGDFFQPFHELGPLTYYPHEGDGVNLNGLAISVGDVVSSGRGFRYEALYISEENEATFEKPDWEAYNAISGDMLFIQEGRVVIPDYATPYHTESNPRTAIAVNEAGDTLWLVVVDGRQPNYSEGVSIQELADIMLGFGAYTALNMDGGGSSTVVIEGEDGKPDVLNSPIHMRIPRQERPIGNHLGIYALPLAN
jgi:hypothetical protein